MQILCPHCNNWSDAQNSKCPVCGGDMYDDLESNQGTAESSHNKSEQKEQKSKSQKTVNIAIIYVIVILIIIVTISVALALHVPAHRPTVTTPSDLKPINDLYGLFQNCLPPFDIALVPNDADPQTILNMQTQMYKKHIQKEECVRPDGIRHNGKMIYTEYANIVNGSGWLSKNDPNIKLLHDFDDSFFKGNYHGCVGHPISLKGDDLRLYIRQKTAIKSNIEFVISSGGTHFFETLYAYQATPINGSTLLFGIDNEAPNNTKLHKIKDHPYYKFDAGNETFYKMTKGSLLRIVMHIKGPNNQSFIMYRAYPLTVFPKTYASTFQQACTYIDPDRKGTMQKAVEMDYPF